MNVFSVFAKEDFLMIKWQIAFALFSLILAAAIVIGIDYLNDHSLRDMRIAQSDYDAARSRVEKIEDEEATIIEYIGRYKELEDDGVVDEEDRLGMLEKIANLRADNNLFPVSVNITKQTAMRLAYGPEVSEPGGPIDLRSSIIQLDLPLLHEEDLIRLLDGILSSPGMYQTKDCEIGLQDTNRTNFIALAQHFRANCEIFWYTFDLDPPPPANQFGF